MAEQVQRRVAAERLPPPLRTSRAPASQTVEPLPARESRFYNGLGVQVQSNASALLLFMLVSPVFTLFMQPISAYFQRKFEFEADDFAADHAQASKMISGLVKLYEENASTLTPDPLYSAFHYSHPPAAIRVAHLESKLTNA
jgi:STE24 endopeptidase